MSTYERINDLVYMLSPKAKLYMSVVLCSRSSNNGNIKYPYHQEFDYDKFGETVITIKREAIASLIFRINNDFQVDVSFGAQHFDRFYQRLNSCKKWFDGTTQVFVKKNNALYIAKDNPDRSPIVISELYENKWIALEPIVMVAESSPGVRFNFNNQTVVDISVDKFYGLVHVLTGFNMYNAMSSLLNYVNTCTPGTNITHFGTGLKSEGDVSGVNGRKQLSKSFFDD